MSFTSSNQSGLASDESVNSDQVYEHLDPVANKKKGLQEEPKGKKQDAIGKKEEEEVETKGENDHSKQLELPNEKGDSYCCNKCVALETKLKQVTLQKERAVQQLLKQTKRLQLLQQKHSENVKAVSQQQYDYCLTSFQQIIKSYEEQHRKILKVVGDTLKVNFSQTNKSLLQIIDSIVTEFMVNFRQISLELSCLERQSSTKTFDSHSEDEGNHGYYHALRKIQNIRENVQQLKKTQE